MRIQLITLMRTACGSRGGMHSQASYWFSIGFKQMVCTVATCYWFLVLLWFYKTQSFLSLEHYNRVPHCPKFFLFILTIIFSHILGDINSKLWICKKKFTKLLVKELCSSRKWKPCFSCCMCVCMHKWFGGGEGCRGGGIHTYLFNMFN